MNAVNASVLQGLSYDIPKKRMQIKTPASFYFTSAGRIIFNPSDPMDQKTPA